MSRQFTASTAQQRNGCLVAIRHPAVFLSGCISSSRARSPPCRRIGPIGASIDPDVCLRRVPDVHGVVSVAQGRLRGVWREDLWSFRAFPTPGHPVGALRWRPPLEADCVERGPRRVDLRADRPAVGRRAWHHQPVGPGLVGAAQRGLPFAQRLDPGAAGESPTATPGTGRPVMVFIHGGGFTSGSGSVFLYRGGDLVRNGDAVVVTINYRLGALGFLGHRDLGDPDGLRRELGPAGPDRRVALGARQHRGRSAVTRATSRSSASPPAGSAWPRCWVRPPPKGLFRRAIVQSGGVHVHTLDEAERSADRLAGGARASRPAPERRLEPIPAHGTRGGDRGDRASAVPIPG